MINLSLISPSSVGSYGACGKRLVLDSKHGKPYSSNSAADFGTVCHYRAMMLLGCGPLDEPKPAVVKGAAQKFMSDSRVESQAEADMWAQAEKCAIFANKHLPSLAAGVTWIAERKVNDPTLLPDRVNREGKKLGYGGSIDLLASDNSHIVDYKFTGELPDYVKVEYLWQMASYSFLKDVPLTTILFTTRDALRSTSLTIDWRLPVMAELRADIRQAIHHMGLVDFERRACPVYGPHCDWCDHKARCGAHPNSLPIFRDNVAFAPPKPSTAGIDRIRQLLALKTGIGAPPAPEPKAVASGVVLDSTPAQTPAPTAPKPPQTTIKTNLF